MSLDLRKSNVVLNDIRKLVLQKGYIYSLSMILFDDSHINLFAVNETDHKLRLTSKECAVILGFFIQNDIDFSTPDDPSEIISMKDRTYELMDELHQSFKLPFFEEIINNPPLNSEDAKKSMKEVFSKGELLSETILYSGGGAYYFQYLEMLERKYKYDREWLLDNKQFDIEKVTKIVNRIRDILVEKSKKVKLKGLREQIPKMFEQLSKKHPNEDWTKHINEMRPSMEFYQYSNLFFEYIPHAIPHSPEEGWKSFYIGLIELFTIRKSDFDSSDEIDSFLLNFSNFPSKQNNDKYQNLFDFNLVNSKPILQLDNERWFVPNLFQLCEAVYESPFYWMTSDKDYRNELASNRGRVGEEITYDLLSKIFGEQNCHKSVKISSKKGELSTDIDILCFLGNKAICIQVKSKKLTMLARSGDDNQLRTDFQAAVQDAYDQGLVSKKEILKRQSTFLKEDGSKLNIPFYIDDVYIICVTTENYPSLTHQSHVMLDKQDHDPYPLVLTVFDLELLAHYLKDPYELVYYVKQRISLMDYFKADEEMVFLGYHLTNKLWKSVEYDYYSIDSSVGTIVDRNYFPYKLGLTVSDEEDLIGRKNQDPNFERLYSKIKQLDNPKSTDIIFYLLNFSDVARKRIVDLIIETKKKTLMDGKDHDVSFPPDIHYIPKVVITYFSSGLNDILEITKKVSAYGIYRKYKSKGDIWIGLVSIKESTEMIDFALYTDFSWMYDEELEKDVNNINLKPKVINFSSPNRKIGRNDKCICGSNLKYKKCCGAVGV